MLPSGPRPGLEEIEPRLLYSADAALLLGGLPVADVRQVASASAAASSQDDSGARWLLVDRRAEDWDRLLAEAQALDPSRPLQLRWVEPDEDGAALRTAVGEGDGAQAALVAAWTDADGRAWLGRSALDAEPPPPPVAAALAAAVETGPAEDWTLAVRRELVIIDGRIEGAGALAALWWQDENSTRTLEVIVTDPSRDGLSQIGELLAARGGQEGLAALHLVGHGTAGQFSFGGDAIDAGTLARHEAALRAWGQALAENGDLLLYGCDTGAGSQGEALLEALQALTGADVAASTDATGGSAAGADWDLEATRGAIETTLAAPVHEALMRWEGRLASYVVTDFSDNVFSFFTLRAAIDSANASPGADTITFANGGVPVTILLNAMLPMITDRITIDGSSGGVPTVAIDGRFLGAGADGLQLYTGSDGSTVRGLALQNFSQDGIDISGSGSHVIAGNRIGLDLSGNAAGNQQGVNLWNTSGNRIGGSSAADRNIISGNSGVGIYIGGGSTANRIEGNWIGLDSTGAAAMANPYGILVQSAGNTIGGAGSGAGNIVSGNLDGIVLWGPSASANQILGNRIGLSASGSSAIGNTFDGIRLENGASGNTLGGASAGLRNVISGNGRDGVRITDENSDGNAVLGNWIGSNAAGTAVLGNGGDGIFIRNGADSSRIGGAAPGEGNWVIGAGLVGIEIDGDSTGTTIRGNRVGTDLAGTANLGAQQNGILLENGAAQTSIVENTVAFSGQGGVYTAGIDLAWSAGSSNLISRNTLYSNVGQDINLGASGLDGNDSLDADSGANDLQNRPLLTRATLGAGTLQVIGQLDSAASALYRIEFFADPGGQGDARVYLGQTTVTSDAGGRASIDVLLEASLVAGTTVTATATRVSSGSTSEAAVPVTVAARANTAPGFVAASGQVITPVSGGDDWIRAMQIQDDGRILVAGHQPGAGGGQDVLLMRYRADGTLDTTFGSGGRVTVAAASFGGTTAQVWAMAVQADGAIVLAGQTTVGGVQYALVQRYLADGSLDIRFSGDGTALWGDVSQFCEASAVAIDAQGRIVLGGTVSGATAVARVTVDGMLDASFGGGNGYAWVDAGLGADLVGALAIQSDGRILLGGSAGNDHALVRWNDDGTLDAGFGSGGIVRTDVAGGFDMIRALVVQDDGRILAGGYSTQAGGDIDFTLLRYLASGSVDTGFSSDGRVTTDLGGADIVQAMVRDASGRIVLAGYDGSGRIALVRHLADGSLDTAFGQGGLVQQVIGASSGAGALALRPDGRLVAAGWSSDGTQRDPLLLGLLTDGSLDPGVGSAAATLGGTVAWTEDSAAVVLDADVRLNDADLAQAGSYAGATLTLARQGGAQAQDQLAFDGLVVTVSGSAVLVDGVQVGSYTFTGGQMQVSFGAQATQDRVDRLARHIVYWNSSDSPPASVTIVWTLADGNTGAQGSGGALAGAGSVTVAITAVNDAPSGSPATIAVTDTTPRTFSAADFGYSDPEGDALHSVTITTLPGRGVLMLDGQKVAAGQAIAAADLARLTWLPTGLVGSASTAFTFQVRDGGGALDATPDTLTLQITAVNDAPLLALGAGNLVQDGSFENGGAAWSGNAGLEVLGTDRLAEFQVAAPPEGSHFAEIEGFGLNGSTPSWIEQTIATTAGQRYVFSLAAATRNQYNIDDIGALSVDGVELLRFTASDDWRRHAVSFVASGATATIRISSLGSITGFTAPGDSIGLLVDDVRVSTVAGSAAWTEGAAPVVLAPEALPVDAELDAQADWSGATLVLARQGGADASDVFGASGTLGALNTGGALQLGGITVGSVVANSGGQLSLAFAGGISADSVRDVLRQITWASSSDAPPAAVTLDWLLSDGSATASASSVVAVSAVNDAPTLALPGRQSTPVDTPLVLDSASGRAPQVADADAALLQVTLTSDGHGLLTLSGTTGLSFSVGDGSADTAMTFSGSAAAINAALDGLRFAPSAAYQGSATIGFSVSDLGGSGSGGTLTTTGSVIVEVGALRFRDGSAGYAGTKDTYVDDSAPGSAFGTSTTVRADDGSPRQTALIRFDQIIGNGAGQIPAGAIITSATLSLYVTERDLADTVVLHRMRIDWSESSTHASLVNGIQADGSDAEASGITIDAGLSGWINISGLAAAVQAWVDGAPNFGWAIVSDAADTWAFASSESVDLALRPYLTVAYTVPQTPVLGTSAGGASYVENAAPVAVDPALTLSDADSTQLSGASVVISAGHVAAQDVLSWAAVTGISGSWNAATGTLSFSGTAALADYRTLLRSVSYANSSDSPSGASRMLSFTVTDTTGLSSAAATRSIQLSAVNDAPTVASPIADQSATEDQSFSFQIPAGTFADVDAGDSLSYTTSTLPSWLSFNAATRTFSGTPANADVGSLTITVTAKDGSNAAASDSFVLTVTNVNDAPTVATPIADQSATEDQPFSFQLPAGTFADVDAGDSLSYTTSTLPSWLSFDAATRTFSGTPANADVGSLTITVTAKDGSNAAASDSFVLTVTNVNDAPTVASPIADQSATEDQPFSFQLPAGTFADVDAGDSLSYTTSTLPSWLSFNAATRTFSGTPANADVGSLTITVAAKDGSNATASDSFVLTVTNVNDAPTVATPIADQDATEDQPFSFQIPAGTFADVDAGDSLSYTTSALPSWLSFNAATRTFSGTPANADVGSLTITVTAKDGSNAAASDSFVLTVTNVNDVPTVASPITDQSATEDQPFSFQIPAGTFADVDAGDSLSYTTSTLPSWLSFNAATRTFSGTPANADIGSLTITVTAKDGSNATASDSFVLTIANVNDAPTVASPIADQSAAEDQSFSFQLPAGTFADVDAGDSLSYTTSALPGWLSFNAATRTFSGTPANADVGSLTITVTAKDGSNAAASDSFVLTIANVNDAPTVATPIADQSATEDQPFSFQIPSGTFADVDAGDSLSYTTSTLPSWLSFDAATRTFSGTPANGDVGSLTITVTAKDGSNATASDSFVLTIANVNDAPILQAGGPLTLEEGGHQ
ncbi:MAG: putative Ig domain-containing protein, partial [Sphaerotilus natans subsp. sulfidivorans]|uniref:putative Ig domain-containing protein n=1 Tax=Sphaerotilus sulfidivorans TaxID=639200 RepID=UPI0023535E2E